MQPYVRKTDFLNKNLFCAADLPELLNEDANIEILRLKALDFRIRNFGRTVRIYRPIYVSNYCVNDCLYCGCAVSVDRARRILTLEEVRKECEAIKKDNIDSVLLVAGEDRRHCSVDYLVSAIRIMKGYFSYVSVEAGVFEPDECRKLVDAGADSFVLYQETYDRYRYSLLHRGLKKDFHRRINSLQVAVDAGFQSIGMGILLGIADWKEDAYLLAKHAEDFRRKNWRCSVSFSFPRLRPPADDKFPEYRVGEDELERIILAFRIIFPDAEINISTRERAEFRDSIVKTSATTMSAASGTYPGAYSVAIAKDELEQFEIQDNRSVAEICEALNNLHLQAVFKYWDRVLIGDK